MSSSPTYSDWSHEVSCANMFQSAVAHELFSDKLIDLSPVGGKEAFQSAVAHELFSDGLAALIEQHYAESFKALSRMSSSPTG